MRGKPGACLRMRTHGGLIPAHAGKTAARRARTRGLRAHPRACGENQKDERQMSFKTGSSPRMRGKRGCEPGHRGNLRLIPAHAGKTPKTQSHDRRRWAHPRACGENATQLVQFLNEKGSSPRMRGKLFTRLGDSEHARLIPAHAGKTPDTQNGTCAVGAHPRACGENSDSRVVGSKCEGSSPRMRGKR